jgi:aminopeptidase N
MDFPAVRTTLEFHFVIPKYLKAFANGLLTNEEILDDEFIISHWKCDHICPSYLLCFGVGKFNVTLDEKVDNIQVAYISPEGINVDDVKRSFDQTPNIIRYLQKKLKIPFPFPKYYILISPKGGAMENISIPSFGFSFVHDELLSKEYKWNTDRVNIHECAHSYFGDSVVIKHFEHVWLKEGWAKYMEHCWFTDTLGKDEGDYQLYSQMKKYMREADNQYVRPIVTKMYDTSWDMYDSHCYPGGSWRIHQLKKLLGEDIFWDAVSKYLKRFEKSLVETDDFRKCLEEESGLNLTKYFDEWFYSKGYPMISATALMNSKEGYLRMDFSQTQKNEKKEIGYFTMDLEVELTFIENNEKKIVNEIASFKDGKCRFKVITKNAPSMIRIDPNLKYLFKLDFSPGEDILTYTMTNAEDIFNRIRSGLTLINKFGSKCYSTICKVMQNESFFGVRETLYSAMISQKVFS